MSYEQNYQSEELSGLLKSKYMSSSDMIKTIKKYQSCRSKDKKDELRDIIFNNNIRFVRKLAHAHSRKSGADVDELFNSGAVGLLEGLDKFKIYKNVQFTTYIKFWIDKGMFDCIHSQNILYIPKNHFYNKFRPKAMTSVNSNLLYLDSVAGPDGEGTRELSDLIADPNSSNAEENYTQSKDIEVVFKIINKVLNVDERIMIRSKFIEGKTLEQISKYFDVKPSTIWFRVTKAMYKLRKAFKQIKKDGEYALNDSCPEELSKIINSKSRDRRGYMLSPDQKLKISMSRQNTSSETRRKLSKASKKLSIDIIKNVKEQLLAGQSQLQVARNLNISKATIYNIYKNKLIYAIDAGIIFTDSDIVKIKKHEDINRFRNGIEANKKLEARKAVEKRGKRLAEKKLSENNDCQQPEAILPQVVAR